MHHRFFRTHAHVFSWHYLWYEQLLVIFLALVVFVVPVSAAMRFQERSLYMESSQAGEVTEYTVSFRYMSPQPVGSVDMLFCVDPIPYHDCETPPGFDASGAQLVSQSGETGFSILSRSTNHIVLTRASTMIDGSVKSSYTFKNIKSPQDTTRSFAIRLRSHTTANATGPQVDFGSVKGQATQSIMIETQVPPMLIFCVAQQVADDCTSTDETYYTDMGVLDGDSTLTAQSQMAIGTNASAGFVVTANGVPMSAGTTIIRPLAIPTESAVGNNQFGINLVANDQPVVGSDPQGPWTNAVATPDYSITNHYKFVSGDVVAYSPNVSLMRKFTVSYIVNAHPDLRAGVYTTTLTYIASGRF